MNYPPEALLSRSLCKWVCAAGFAWLLTLSTSAFAAAEVERQYLPKELPESSSPGWKLQHGEAKARVEEGSLKVDVKAGARHYYAIGNNKGVSWGDSDLWNLKPGDAVTIEFRVRCLGENPEYEVFRVQIGDGERQWGVPFTPNRVAGQEKEASVWDTYRITLQNGELSLSSEQSGLLVKRSKGTENRGYRLLLFGSFSSQKALQGEPYGSWEVEFIRWKIQRQGEAD